MPRNRKRKNKRSLRFSKLAHRRWSKFSDNADNIAEHQEHVFVASAINSNSDDDVLDNVLQVSVTTERE